MKDMKKIYANPMLQVVSIQKNDILTDSPRGRFVEGTTSDQLAPDRFGDWDEGY